MHHDTGRSERSSQFETLNRVILFDSCADEIEQVQIIMMRPLQGEERNKILTELLKRAGARKVPSTLLRVTNHAQVRGQVFFACVLSLFLEQVITK